MVPTASLMAPKALATTGSLISTSAVATVATSPIAACRIETARRFSPSAQAIASSASTPNADCSCSMDPPNARRDYASGPLQSAMLPRADRCGIDKGAVVGHGSIMSSMTPVGARDLLTHRSFLLFLLSRSLSRFSSQIGAVAIGWQIYDLTGSAFDLGMVGLV